MSGRFEYAEGWRKHLHLGFCSADADPLAAALGDLVIDRRPPTALRARGQNRAATIPIW